VAVKKAQPWAPQRVELRAVVRVLARVRVRQQPLGLAQRPRLPERAVGQGPQLQLQDVQESPKD
jgi:hypothetical protein